uniref:Cysteine--tRNA ligase n=1 Tax=Parascaris univalens TaxID=6257 RepID=A0A915BRM7_PARUN
MISNLLRLCYLRWRLWGMSRSTDEFLKNTLACYAPCAFRLSTAKRKQTVGNNFFILHVNRSSLHSSEKNWLTCGHRQISFSSLKYLLLLLKPISSALMLSFFAPAPVLL